jgi:hypothetical protein
MDARVIVPHVCHSNHSRKVKLMSSIVELVLERSTSTTFTAISRSDKISDLDTGIAHDAMDTNAIEIAAVHQPYKVLDCELTLIRKHFEFWPPIPLCVIANAVLVMPSRWKCRVWQIRGQIEAMQRY